MKINWVKTRTGSWDTKYIDVQDFTYHITIREQWFVYVPSALKTLHSAHMAYLGVSYEPHNK